MVRERFEVFATGVGAGRARGGRLRVVRECRVSLLEGKVGVVTGGAQGLGEAVARLACAEGAAVVIADVAEDRAAEVAAEIAAAGGRARACRTDVTRAEDLEAVVRDAVASYGGLDWLCNNAVGGAGDFGPLHEIDERGWTASIDVCLKGVFYGMRAAIPVMLEAGGGSIVNVTTAGVFKGEAMLGAYVAAKGGVHSLTQAAAAEYAARGIRVNSVAPGGMETRAIQRYFAKFPEFREATVAQHAMRRLGRPEEVAEAVVWLACDRASFVTGSCLVCDGGSLVNSHLL